MAKKGQKGQKNIYKILQPLWWLFLWFFWCPELQSTTDWTNTQYYLKSCFLCDTALIREENKAAADVDPISHSS